VLVLIGLVVLALILVNVTAVQNYIAKRAVTILAEKLKTNVSVRHVRIDFANRLLIQGLYIEDRHHDTLLYAGEAELKVSDWFYIKGDKPVITYLGLHDAFGHLTRSASSKDWNYQFVIDAFDTGPSDKTKSKNEFELDLKHLDLKNVRFFSDDAWAGDDMDITVGTALIDGREIDLKKRMIDLQRIALTGTSFVMRSYKGGKPPRKGPRPPDPIDTTAFNTGGWVVKLADLRLKDCRYALTSTTKPALKGEFDPEHLDFTGTTLLASNLRIVDDTLRASLDHFETRERCGMQIREIKGDVTVSPNASILDNLVLKTERSTLGPYYAMRYKRFPAFIEYIDSVRMEARLSKSVIDPADIAYFASVFPEYFPRRMKVSGRFDGTVADFKMGGLRYEDGPSTVTGNLRMHGLPDIFKTYIEYEGGSIQTSGSEILRFAPMLKNNPGFNLERLTSINYTGSYKGFIEDFAADGTLQTNLGVIRAKSKLAMPGFETQRSKYETELQAINFYAGPLLNQPFLGAATFTGSISGNGFEPGNAAIRVNVAFDKLGLYGYNYSNIVADGVLQAKTFTGHIQVNDPSISGSFDGTADFKDPGKLTLQARAHILNSDLQTLHLSDPQIFLAADFDIDASGSTLDNFTGKALLNNLNILRGKDRLDLDSVALTSGLTTNGEKFLELNSNGIAARIEGRYQLSQLQYSVQYFLAQYLPSYIPKPSHYAPDQDLRFAITTTAIDSLLLVLKPSIRGFDNSRITGALNTSSQQLSLDVALPYARIGSVRMNNLILNGSGNFSGMKISGDVSDITIGDTLLRLSLNLNSNIAEDSIAFNITTSSPGSYGTATLNGNAVTRGDSIRLTMAPSEFYLNQSRWEVEGGSSVVYRDNYLAVRDLKLHSGLQQINVYSENEADGETALVMNASNLDLGQLSGAAGLAEAGADGRISGNIRVTDLFRNPSAFAMLNASNVKLGADTIGNIFLTGSYNSAKGTVSLEKGTGIFRGMSSMTVEGTLAIDSTSTQHLNGVVTLYDAPLAWLNPVLKGYVSKLSGSVNGKVSIGGTGQLPDVDGKIQLSNATLRVDYLGTLYTIPDAQIGITNTSIVFSAIKLKDIYDNDATLTGSITHDRFRNIRLGLNMKSNEFEVLNLQDYENSSFYGHLVARVESMSVSGTIEDLRMNIRASPADISHLYLPVATGGDIGSYTYVSFKKYGEDQQVYKTAAESKLTINIDAIINPLAEVTLILDPTTGDAINARGTGSLRLEVPAGGDLRMYGNFNIDEGDYTFTFRQLFFKRQFLLQSGSSVRFSGPIAQTTLDVNATYRTRASLYDLLSSEEKSASFIPANEMSDIKRQQDVDVLLNMRKNILQPELSFQLALPEKRSVGTYAYNKFERLNANPRDLFNQVASLLLIGYFIPPEGLGGNTSAAVASGALNNISELLSTNTSAQLTNIVNKLLGDPKLSVDLKYKNYNVADNNLATGPINRNEVKLGLRKNLLNDRLVLEVGSSYDWGRPVSTAATSSNFNLLNDFRIQYLLSKDGRLRLNGFRTNDYDVLLNNGTNISRAGMGISWRKTFDSFPEFWHSSKYYSRQQRRILEEQQKVDSNTLKKVIGDD
jgi:hypothetical protein